jgi:hypothetical protein
VPFNRLRQVLEVLVEMQLAWACPLVLPTTHTLVEAEAEAEVVMLATHIHMMKMVVVEVVQVVLKVVTLGTEILGTLVLSEAPRALPGQTLLVMLVVVEVVYYPVSAAQDPTPIRTLLQKGVIPAAAGVIRVMDI